MFVANACCGCRTKVVVAVMSIQHEPSTLANVMCCNHTCVHHVILEFSCKAQRVMHAGLDEDQLGVVDRAACVTGCVNGGLCVFEENAWQHH